MPDLPTVLLAEDDDGHAYLIQNSLRKAGYRNSVVRFSDGQEALDYLLSAEALRLAAGGSLVLLLDIRMPKVDGIEVLRRVRDHPTLRAMAVIMVTTTDDPSEMARCRLLGCTFYLTKPIDWKQFVLGLPGISKWLNPSGAAPS